MYARGVLDDTRRESWHWFGAETREVVLVFRVYTEFLGAVLVCYYVSLSMRW